MATHAEDSEGKYIMLLNTQAVISWAKEATPAVRRFLKTGEADEATTKAMQRELTAKAKRGRLPGCEQELLAKLKERLTPPLYVAGG